MGDTGTRRPNTPLRILHVIKHCDHGHGSVHVAVDLACIQARQGFDVMYASAGGDFGTLLERNGVHCARIVQDQNLVFRLSGSLLSFLRLCKRFRPDIIHAHMMSSAAFGYVASKLFRIPLITTVHNSFDKHSILMRLGQTVVAVSEAERELLVKHGFPDRKLEIVWNGPAHSPRETFGAKEDFVLNRPNVVTVCGLHKRKGVHDLILAFTMAQAEVGGWNFYIIGDGPDRSELENLARASGVEKSVHFLGSVQRPKRLLEQTDIFALASYAEPFGLVLAEARSAGCAIVATEIGGIPEVLEFGRAGQLVPAGAPARFAKAFSGLMRDRLQREHWREQARIGTEIFSVERMAAEYSVIYKRAANVGTR